MSDARRSLPEHPDEVRMSFGEHLEDLRWRVMKALLGVVVTTGICIYFGDWIIQVVTAPYKERMIAHGFPARMITTDPSELFMQYFSLAVVFGLGLAAPWVLYQLWQFVAAGLYPTERRYVHLFAPMSMALFYLGVFFLIKLVLPLTLEFLIGVTAWYPEPGSASQPALAWADPPAASAPVLHQPPATIQNGQFWINADDDTFNYVVGGKVLRLSGTEIVNNSLVQPMYTVSEYLGFVNGMCLAFGLGFQIPIVIVGLVLVRVLSADRLARMRKIIIVLIVAGGAILTPSGDISSQLLLAVPMYALFELGLLIARRIEAGRMKSA